MSSAPTPAEIARDAHWLAQALGPATGVVRLVAMDRESYRAASFLDDRLMLQPVDAQILSWPDVEAAVSGELRSDARWIFHIGHVGSTLISRLLGEIDGVLSVREPRLLRDVAIAPSEVRAGYIGSVPKLMSRTFDLDELACVKATSFASEIAAELIPSGERALFMYAGPRNYVANILTGENSLKELRRLAEYRSMRLAVRGIALPSARDDAEHAAAAWACEMISLEAAAEALPDRRIAWMDFDRALGDLPNQLAQTADFFGFDARRDDIERIASGPLITRYSKAPEHAYSAGLRRELIGQGARQHGEDIAAALVMLERAAQESPLLARALSRSNSEG
jgi:hypothetical protein